MLLSVYLRERFTDPVDFTDRVPLEHLVDEAGRIAWDRVALLADELLEARPHLATPEERAEAQCPPGGLQWLATET